MIDKLTERIERLESRASPEGRDADAESEIRQELIRHPKLMDVLRELQVCDDTGETKVTDPARIRELKIEFNNNLPVMEANLSERARRIDMRFKV